jgi:hypothetical protein
MADTQEAPQVPVGLQPIPALRGSVTEAQEALLSLMEPEEEKPKDEEAAPTEEEESTEEIQDESLEEESEEESEEEVDEEEAEESDEEEEDEEEPLFTVTANGQEIEVTYDELLKGYSRQSDYTRKTQELSNLRQEYERGAQQYAQSLPELQNLKQQYSQALGESITNSTAGLERFNIDWDRLREEDGGEYLLKREEFRQAQDEIRALEGRKQYEDAQLAQEGKSQLKQRVAYEHSRMAETIPEWNNTDSRNQLSAEIKNYALSVGFTQEELAYLYDHKQLLTLMKAMRFDALQKPDLKAKKIKNKPKVVRSGKGVEKSDTDNKKRAAQMKRLRQSGRADDASVLLEDFIEL